ncbi:MAG: hypothetical protein WD512_04130 [Candidatus Paceibacterota bacterium]
MFTFKQYINEGYSIQYIRDKNVDVLKIKESKKNAWVEVRGKKNYEINYNSKDPLHKLIDQSGKAANISDLMNGNVISINPNHPNAKKAIEAIRKHL